MNLETESLYLRFLSHSLLEIKECLNVTYTKNVTEIHDVVRLFHVKRVYSLGDAYVLLRKTVRMEASALLFRPAIESLFHLEAIKANPHIVYRIANHEHKEDIKWMRSHAPDQMAADAQMARNWDEFVMRYKTKYPSQTLNEHPANIYDLASAGGLTGYYNSHYRLYCQQTHAALRALTGDLKSFEKEDSRVMSFVCLAAVNALSDLGFSFKSDELASEFASLPHP